ncbi:MAG: DUF2779 domain-containing protein [Candidatus Marinimicrobia bacterium]|nr:DUF2779 domain-containing protein [Candidatus Neomarinimicrobiota bacterium]MCF7880189.1 DUF2779 domain-containing protein [Candidatus Neomarinimicrobiota bacterium]
MAKGNTMTHRLSKSRFLSGIQCTKKLWIETYNRALIPPPSPADQRIFDQGHQVGQLARDDYTDGVLIEPDHFHIPEAMAQTEQAIDSGVKVLFEGAFAHEEVLVRPDILRRTEDDTWQLMEVKSSTRVKDEHIQDVAIQEYVLEGAGLPIASTHLMHVNRECVYPDLSNFFTTADITTDVAGFLPEVPDILAHLFATLDRENKPVVPIGKHCTSPYDCPLVEYCWDHVPEYSIFTVPRLNWDKKDQLMADDILAITDIPDAFPLSDTQQEYVDCVQAEDASIDWEGIRQELARLEYPLYFLDFETDNPAVPRFEGMRPYDQFPFQYSCHILQEDGSLDHVEYLHTDQTDPRGPVAEHLVKSIGAMGSVIAYNAGFEKRILADLRDRFSTLQEPLQGMIDRLWDQLVIFRKHYTDYRFRGSNSIKAVLPVLVPELAYEDLEIQGGEVAQVAWNELLDTEDEAQRKELIQSLLAYCRRDTLGMVEIYRQLVDLNTQ